MHFKKKKAQFKIRTVKAHKKKLIEAIMIKA